MSYLEALRLAKGIAADADERCSFVQKKVNNQWLQQGRVG
jgi:hypothetical protein